MYPTILCLAKNLGDSCSSVSKIKKIILDFLIMFLFLKRLGSEGELKLTQLLSSVYYFLLVQKSDCLGSRI